MTHLNTYFFKSLKDLPGVGSKTYDLLRNLGCSTFFDLLIHFPSRFILKQFEPRSLASTEEGEHIIVSVNVKKISRREKNQWRKQITTVHCCNKFNEELELVFFNYFPDYIFKNLKLTDTIIVSGKLQKKAKGFPQLLHPKIYRTISQIKKVDAVYPLVAGLASSQLSRFIEVCIENSERQNIIIDEWLEPDLLNENNWLSFFESIKAIHTPQDEKDLAQQDRFKERIAFDELLANQLAIRISRKRHLDNTGEALNFSGELAKKVLASTKMILTKGQESSLCDIQNDQASSKRMVRLLQGDVGSGKTLVALLAILNAIEAGKQAGFMVPTDILSKQHFSLISSLLKPYDINVELLTGAATKKQRKNIAGKLLSGEINILIGTHALFQEGVEFKNLGLVIIDEQHRFGVQQRLAFMNKNNRCDVLAMSATPIPRTLSLIMYGDMDVSILKDKPAGRMPIKTLTTLDSKIHLIVEMIKQKVADNEKVFWICPLIEEKEDPLAAEVDTPSAKETNYSTAVARFNFLKERFGEKVGLVHGKLKDWEKEESMNEFAHGNIDVLVATTVVEVGIDVPAATLLVIERADRFGLSQLHQLRGRIGRGNKPSDCILMFSEDIGNIARERLRTMKNSNDGFYIAEQDLKLRGGGEILGHKQSGLPEFKTVDFEKHYHLLSQVSNYADKIIKQQQIKKFVPLMKLFGYDVNIELIDA